MKESPKNLKQWLLPKPEKAVDREIDILNLKTLYYVSLAECAIQFLSLNIFIVTHINNIWNPNSMGSIINVVASIALCIIGFIVSGYFRRKKDIIACHIGINVFVSVYLSLLLIWGLMASIQTYIRGEQIVTFFTVELIAVLFIRLRPLISAVIILSSYVAAYIVLDVCINSGMINPYNYFMMGIISVAGTIIIYQTTISYIEQKIESVRLSESLEVIANHDALTRLQNRYSLNQRIPDYLGNDICLAMGDIDRFKSVNDTYGHRIGDEVLEAFADILLESFEHEDVYRYGGDEFLIVSRNQDYASFRAKLDELNEKLSKVNISGIEDSFSCSFGGISAHPEVVTDFFDMVMRADKKLYEEKFK